MRPDTETDGQPGEGNASRRTPWAGSQQQSEGRTDYASDNGDDPDRIGEDGTLEGADPGEREGRDPQESTRDRAGLAARQNGAGTSGGKDAADQQTQYQSRRIFRDGVDPRKTARPSGDALKSRLWKIRQKILECDDQLVTLAQEEKETLREIEVKKKERHRHRASSAGMKLFEQLGQEKGRALVDRIAGMSDKEISAFLSGIGVEGSQE